MGYPPGWFTVMCKIGARCPGPFDIFASNLPYTASALFLLTLLIYCVLDHIRNRK
jgi:hypothetical protein